MIVNEQQLAENNRKSMSSYLAPRVRDIQPSGIRKFLISSVEIKILSHLVSVSLIS